MNDKLIYTLIQSKYTNLELGVTSTCVTLSVTGIGVERVLVAITSGMEHFYVYSIKVVEIIWNGKNNAVLKNTLAGGTLKRKFLSITLKKDRRQWNLSK